MKEDIGDSSFSHFEYAYSYNKILCKGNTIIDFQILDSNKLFNKIFYITENQNNNNNINSRYFFKDIAKNTNFNKENILKSVNDLFLNKSFEEFNFKIGNNLFKGIFQYINKNHFSFSILNLSDFSSIKNEEKIFSKIFNNNLFGIYIFNALTWKINHVNSLAIHFSGYSFEELTNKLFTELIEGLSLAFFSEMLEQLIEKVTEKIVIESFIKTKNNMTYPVEIVLMNLDDDSNNIMAFVKDISEKAKLERQIQLEMEYINYVIDATEIGTWKWNIETGETEYNEQWAKMLGYNLDELAPIDEKTWERLVHPDDLAKSDYLVKKHFNKEIPLYNCEIRIKHKDGSYRWIEDKGKIIYWSSDGKPLLMYGIHQDITDRKKIELQLYESHQLFQNLAESSLTNISLFQNHHCIYANPSFIQFTGFNFNEIVKMDLKEFFYDEDIQELENILSKLDKKNDKSEPFSLRMKDSKKKVKWIHGAISKVIINNESSLLFSFNDITKIKEDEKEILNSRTELQNIISAANLGTWVWNVQTNETIYNETWANLLGYKLSELQPVSLTTWENLTDPEDVKRTYIELDKHFNGLTEFYECEIKMKHKNGTWIWILDKGKVIKWDDKGKPLLMFGIHVDITKRKEIEQKIAEKNKFIDMILKAVPVRVFWKDKNMTYLGCNTLFAKDAGVEDPSLIIGKTDYDFPWKSEAESYRKDDSYVISTGNPLLAFEEKQTTPDNKTIFLRTNKVPLINENNEIIGVLGTYEDITDLKEKENIILSEKEKLDVIIQSIADGVIAVDKEENVILINKVAQKLTGFEESECIGKKISDVFNIINEITDEKVDNPVKKVIKNLKVQNIENNTVLISKNGERFIIEDSAAPIISNQNELLGVVLVFRDATEKIKLQNEIQKASKLESLSLLASGIAHDFNNLLGGIYGYVNLTLTEDNVENIKENLVNAISTINRAKALSNQLITFSKGGNPQLKKEYIKDLIIEITNFSLSGSNIKAEFQFEGDLMPVLCDKNMISQAIENLMINARQAMEKGGRVYITAQNVNAKNKIDSFKKVIGFNNNLDINKEYILITIKDEGEGIPEDKIKYIFDPFYTTKKDGTGLGLSVVYSIVKKHNGFIEVASQINKGTEFKIYLPAFIDDEKLASNINYDKKKEFSFKKEEEEKNVTELNPAGLSMSKIKKILILDDEIVILKPVVKYLTKKGFLVDETTNGENTLEFYQKSIDNNEKYDLLILDLTVQNGLGGKEVIEKIREKDKDILAIVCSGYSDDTILSEPEKYGFNASIQKPFKFEDLLELILSLQNKNRY